MLSTILLAFAVGGAFLNLNYSRKIMTTQDQLAQSLNALASQLEKAKTEITSEIDTLKSEVTNAGGLSPEVEASLSRLQGIAQGLDDLNPDADSAADTSTAP